MRPGFGARRGTFAALAIAFLALLPGCSKKMTSVDPSYTTPDGTLSPNSRLIVYPDLPNVRSYYLDLPPPGPDPGDPFDHALTYRVGAPTTVHGVILDGTAANGYQVLRRETNGGLRVLKDYVSSPLQRWLDSGWELYAFDDPDTTRGLPPTYEARGVVQGVVSRSSPISGLSTLADTTLADISISIVYGDQGQIPPPPYIDSLFTVKWTAVPNAASYLFDVYQLRGDLRTEDEIALSGVPQPVYFGKTRDLYIALLPPTVTQYKLGDPGLILTRAQTFYGQTYAVRVCALDSQGRMIGFSSGDVRVGLGGDSGYSLYALGSIEVAPTVHPPLEASPAAAPAFVDAAGRRGRVITIGAGAQAHQVIRFE